MTEFKAAFETGTEDFKAGLNELGIIEDSAQKRLPNLKLAYKQV